MKKNILKAVNARIYFEDVIRRLKKMRILNNDPSALLLHIFSRISGTEIQGSPGGHGPLKNFQ